MFVVNDMERFGQLSGFRFPQLVRAEHSAFEQVANDLLELKRAVSNALEASPIHRARIYEVPDTLGELLENLTRDTGIHSSMTPRRNHPNFNKILTFGDVAIRYLLTKMAAGESQWEYFMILRELTGAHPIPVDHQGYFDAINSDWLEWGKANGKLEPLALELAYLRSRSLSK